MSINPINSISQDNQEQNQAEAANNEKLPSEILLLIFSHLETKDLARCRVVCRKWQAVASDDSFWRPFFAFPHLLSKNVNAFYACSLKEAGFQSLQLQGHTGWVGCLTVANGRVYSGSGDKTVRVWDVREDLRPKREKTSDFPPSVDNRLSTLKL